MAITPKLTILIVAGSLMAAGSGALGATALSQAASEPLKTVTVDVGTGTAGAQGERGPIGEQGPPGPAGPPGSPCAGAPAGYTPGILQINGAGGQAKIYTCIEQSAKEHT